MAANGTVSMTSSTKLQEKKGIGEPGPVCGVCPVYDGCNHICHPVETDQLPSMERGRIDPEDLPRLYMVCA